jgi:prevent-host-death family protein
MNVASSDEMALHFNDYLKASATGPVVVTRKGKPVAVLLTAKNDEDLERLLLGHSPKLQTILEAARKRFRDGGGIPHEEFWKEVEAETTGSSQTSQKPNRTRKNGRTARKATKMPRTPSATS